MRDLKDVRRDISAIDHEILKLFLKRMKCAEEVSDYKMEHGGQVLVPSRETELMNTMLQDIPDELKLEYSSLLRTTTRVSRKHQYARMLEAEPQRLQLDLHPRNNDPKTVYYFRMRSASRKTLGKMYSMLFWTEKQISASFR